MNTEFQERFIELVKGFVVSDHLVERLEGATIDKTLRSLDFDPCDVVEFVLALEKKFQITLEGDVELSSDSGTHPGLPFGLDVTLAQVADTVAKAGGK